MFDQIIEYLTEHAWARNVAYTVALLIVLSCLRWVVARSIHRAPIKSTDLRRRWTVQVRNATVVAFLFGALVIWSTELVTFALSIVAFFVAIVLATKELITCFTGGFLKAMSGAFTVGDRIEINGIRGDVVDQGMLTTELIEVGPIAGVNQYSGRTVVLPNSLFVTAAVFNESTTDDYQFHTMLFPIRSTDPVEKLVDALMSIAESVTTDYVDHARYQLQRLMKREGTDTPAVEPRITLIQPDPGRIDLVLRLPVKAKKKGEIDRQIRLRYLKECRRLVPPADDGGGAAK